MFSRFFLALWCWLLLTVPAAGQYVIRQVEIQLIVDHGVELALAAQGHQSEVPRRGMPVGERRDPTACPAVLGGKMWTVEASPRDLEFAAATVELSQGLVTRDHPRNRLA